LNWTAVHNDRAMTAYGYTALATDAALNQNVQQFQTPFQRTTWGVTTGHLLPALRSQTELAAADASRLQRSHRHRLQHPEHAGDASDRARWLG
jgi:hypothetical protein